MNQRKEQSFFQSAVLFLKNFSIRFLIHFLSLICAMQIADVFETFNNISSMIAAYLGLICLFARGHSLQFTWLMPTVIGLAQLFVSLVFAMPFAWAIFFGGLQAYIQRVFIKKFKMGYEWIVLVFLLMALWETPNPNSPVLLIASFILFFFVGLILNQSYAFYMKKQQKAHKLKIEENAKAEEEKNKEPYEDFRQSIKDLYPKQAWLPQELQGTLFTLIVTAEAIIQSMLKDSRDVKGGEKFLSRYLPATHSVLDSYKRYCNSPKSEAITKALEQSEEVLDRLAKAFTQEYEYLLRNDVDDFSANLRVLDTLLKMEGR